MKWGLVLDCRVMSGHAFWQRGGRVAITDDSLRSEGEPWTTDDGLLLVDLGVSPDEVQFGRSLPLVKGCEYGYSTPLGEIEAKMIARRLCYWRRGDFPQGDVDDG